MSAKAREQRHQRRSALAVLRPHHPQHPILKSSSLTTGDVEGHENGLRRTLSKSLFVPYYSSMAVVTVRLECIRAGYFSNM